MKKRLKIIIPMLSFIFFGFMIYNIIAKINHKKEVARNIKYMPKFEYQKLDRTSFTNKNLKPSIPTVFLYFNSDCEFCNQEAQEIKEKVKSFDNVQLVFISFEKPSLIKSFAEKHKLNNYDNISFIHDSKISFSNTFDVKSLPTVIIYNNQNKLVKIFKGQTKVENILNKLEL